MFEGTTTKSLRKKDSTMCLESPSDPFKINSPKERIMAPFSSMETSGGRLNGIPLKWKSSSDHEILVATPESMIMPLVSLCKRVRCGCELWVPGNLVDISIWGGFMPNPRRLQLLEFSLSCLIPCTGHGAKRAGHDRSF